MERNQNSKAVRLPLNLQLFADEGTEQIHTEAEAGAETSETEPAEGFYAFNRFVTICKSHFVEKTHLL